MSGYFIAHETRPVRKTPGRLLKVLGGAAVAAGVGISLWLSGAGSHTPAAENTPAAIVTSAVEAASPTSSENVGLIDSIGITALIAGAALGFASKLGRDRDCAKVNVTTWQPEQAVDFIPGFLWRPEPEAPYDSTMAADATQEMPVIREDPADRLPVVFILRDMKIDTPYRPDFDWRNNPEAVDKTTGEHWKLSERGVFGLGHPAPAPTYY